MMEKIKNIIRVYCLYRVSSKGQVDHDDIPVQREAAQKFVATKPGWKIVREEKELGVSGSKVSAAKRDVIQDYLVDAKNGMFDVLLVFMFDRLGRIEHETPFVLEAFVKSGVECWSVMEGQQKIDNHVDKLMNYIRFWQASGETLKMSQRIGETHTQIVESGHFRGGHVPYGYRAVHKGRVNKKDIPLLDLELDPVTSPIAEEIFHKTVYEGMGSHAIASMLNKRGLTHRTGSKFNSNTILRILKNPVYTGYYVTKKTRSQHLPELQVISIELFNKVVEILHDRARKNEEKRKVALRTKSNALLSGNVYCGHCSTRLAAIKWQNSYVKKDGTVSGTEKIKYACYHKTQGKTDCDGQHTYDADLIDYIVVQMTKDILTQFRQTPKSASIEWRIGKRIHQLQQARKELGKKEVKQQEQLAKLEAEVAKCLMGESSFSEDTLSNSIATIRGAIEQTQNELTAIDAELDNQTVTKDNISRYYDAFESWSDEFDKADMDRKRMILCELYDRIEVRRDNKVTFYVNPNYKQFLDSEGEQVQISEAG